jgi:hypothetical protein
MSEDQTWPDETHIEGLDSVCGSPDVQSAVHRDDGLPATRTGSQIPVAAEAYVDSVLEGGAEREAPLVCCPQQASFGEHRIVQSKEVRRLHKTTDAEAPFSTYLCNWGCDPAAGVSSTFFTFLPAAVRALIRRVNFSTCLWLSVALSFLGEKLVVPP